MGNRYEIIEEIGNGGMAMVYKARCHVLNRYVAIKILRDEFTTDEEFIKRFNTEAQAVASLTHPNIVSVYDVGHEGNLYYIVMELIKGRTLKEIIVSEGVLAWKWCVNVAMQIASALETAHRNNIIHRDIKPHNIIITEDGMAKVTDFGIAKAVSNSTITAFGTTMGSVHDFSPEHARGGFTDAESDLYSLGVVMYEMLTGKLPFEADTPVSVALKHIQEEPKSPQSINASIPNAVNDIVMKAMQKDPNLRYQTAGEMLIDLNKSLKDPDGNFVNISESEFDSRTRVISVEEVASRIKIREKTDEEQNKKKVKKKSFIAKHKTLSAIIGLILLFLIAFGGTSAYINIVTPKDVIMPNLVGLTKEEAKQKTESLKLVFQVEEEVYDTEVEEGKIISQTPVFKSNYKIKEKSAIQVVVSLGQKIVSVPKVIGMNEDDAKAAIEAADLKIAIEEEYNKKIEAGYVISQDVPENTEVGAGSVVTIKVSKGVETSVVPNVVGKTEEEAKQMLKEAGITLAATKYAEDATKEDGTVLEQNLEAGETVEKDSNITITVNKIEALVTGTIKVNLKALRESYGKSVEYTEKQEDTGEKDENGDPIMKTVKQVKTSEVVIQAGNDTIYSEKVAQDKTDLTATVTGRGTIDIKVQVDGVVRKTTRMNLNKETTLTIQ